MIPRATLPQRLARWSLLLAALLHLGGAAVGPYLHDSGLAVAAGAVVVPQGGEEPGAPVPQHDEQACIVCQWHGGAAALSSPSVLHLGPVVAVGDLAPRFLSPADASRPGARARAPPSA